MEVLNRLQASGALDANAAAAVEQLVEAGGATYESALLAQGISRDAVREAFAAEYGVPSIHLSTEEQLPQEVLKYISEESARYYRVVPVKIEDDVLLVGVNDPENLQIREVLNFVSGKHNQAYKLVFMLSDELETALTAYESLSGEVGDALVSLESDLDGEIKKGLQHRAEEGESVQEDIAHLKEDAPVTKIVATILRYAVDGKASDIHIEPNGEKVVVRFRVDGMLSKSLELPKNVQSAVVARVKILANARLDEKRRPQDGRFSANFDGRRIDFRVSILPTNHGEKVVMRILDNVRGVTTLEDAGISPYHLEKIRSVVKEPYGIILISGPTGSGKSTTLYTMLSEVDKDTKNVLSLEDPVEYNIDKVSQSQVRPEIGYTFANGLRSALRQDPDIIMVGEIRDKETAQLAIQAALTGHLVLSTIHTNNSIGVIPRLIDMGVDPYLIAPTLKLAIAQRLARRICPNTGVEMPVEGAVKMMIDKEFSTLPERFRDRIPNSSSMLHPEPSPGCASGTKGRVAVMELLEVNDAIQELILKGGSEEQIFTVAREHGFMSMKEDAIVKALNHVIPYEEMNAFGTKVGLDNVLDDTVLQEEDFAVNDAVPIPSTNVPNNVPAAFDEPVDNQPAPSIIDV